MLYALQQEAKYNGAVLNRSIAQIQKDHTCTNAAARKLQFALRGIKNPPARVTLLAGSGMTRATLRFVTKNGELALRLSKEPTLPNPLADYYAEEAGVCRKTIYNVYKVLKSYAPHIPREISIPELARYGYARRLYHDTSMVAHPSPDYTAPDPATETEEQS